jgi:Ca2+/H+ antiporter
VTPALALSFRPIELATMAASVAVVGAIIWDARGKRWEGAVMIAVYLGMVVLYGFAGDR